MIESDDEKNARISNIVFSQLLPITDNMLEFQVDKEKLKEMIVTFSKQYVVDEMLTSQILKIIDDKEYVCKDFSQDVDDLNVKNTNNDTFEILEKPRERALTEDSSKEHLKGDDYNKEN